MWAIDAHCSLRVTCACVLVCLHVYVYGTYEWDLGLRCEWDMGLRCECDCDAERAFLGHEIGIVINVCRERGQWTPIVRPLPRVVLCCKAESGKLKC